MRTIKLKVEHEIILQLEDEESLAQAMEEIEVGFIYCPDGAENRVILSEMQDYEILNSK